MPTVLHDSQECHVTFVASGAYCVFTVRQMFAEEWLKQLSRYVSRTAPTQHHRRETSRLQNASRAIFVLSLKGMLRSCVCLTIQQIRTHQASHRVLCWLLCTLLLCCHLWTLLVTSQWTPHLHESYFELFVSDYFVTYVGYCSFEKQNDIFILGGCW